MSPKGLSAAVCLCVFVCRAGFAGTMLNEPRYDPQATIYALTLKYVPGSGSTGTLTATATPQQYRLPGDPTKMVLGQPTDVWSNFKSNPDNSFFLSATIDKATGSVVGGSAVLQLNGALKDTDASKLALSGGAVSLYSSGQLLEMGYNVTGGANKFDFEFANDKISGAFNKLDTLPFIGVYIDAVGWTTAPTLSGNNINFNYGFTNTGIGKGDVFATPLPPAWIGLAVLFSGLAGLRFTRCHMRKLV